MWNIYCQKKINADNAIVTKELIYQQGWDFPVQNLFLLSKVG